MIADQIGLHSVLLPLLIVSSENKEVAQMAPLNYWIKLLE